MRKINAIYIGLICVFSLFFFADQVRAAEDDNNLGYTVTLVQSNTQIDPNKSYFYVKTTPGEAQTLEVRVKSTKKENVHIKIYGTNAITGDGGTIEYSDDKTYFDSTLKEPVTSMIKIANPDITIGNYEEKTVKIQLTPPKEKYDGVKMGAIVFALDQGEKAKSGVTTEFSYRVGLITSGSGDEFNNAQTLNLNSAKASIKRGKKMVLANLQNPEPKVLENLSIVGTMTKKGTTEVVKRKSVENYSMAPNSSFDFEMDWGIANLPSGTYTLKLDASNDYQEWQLSKDFTITNQQAKKMNEESAFKIITPTWIKGSAIFLLVVTVLIVSLTLFRRKKWEKQWKKVRIAKRKKQGKQKQKRKKSNRKEGE
ncbi:DUF916 and DUF3324 domain-containing protein [Enterococcus caccae]|uniref:Uncharacterized protein n=1 Tax=Enterococcus caccae ATCC BAA-1240 TaxID=1158612 RepID=R3WPX2_9ENTE|nr:DUF916 and DUF3324 domain-containing protein [Enterococcus caccae]EOL49886.1 hypothetical protein UC7_00551 [Enterococcus caccae ATCC BAA-1240]EOT56226.1 hypothetical protein I580_03026 [Enterococcus caccae ATCC BAA-1240]OJG22690.1 hypothetical protein RU98_GL001964 [Enterococcus caccae]